MGFSYIFLAKSGAAKVRQATFSKVLFIPEVAHCFQKVTISEWEWQFAIGDGSFEIIPSPPLRSNVQCMVRSVLWLEK